MWLPIFQGAPRPADPCQDKGSEIGRRDGDVLRDSSVTAHNNGAEPDDDGSKGYGPTESGSRPSTGICGRPAELRELDRCGPAVACSFNCHTEEITG